MNFFGDALAHLPEAANSPLAYLSYVITVVLAFMLLWRVRRNRNLLIHLRDLPREDRLKAFQAELGQMPLPHGFRPEHNLRAKL